MTLPWFYEDVAIDRAALAWLTTVALQTATALDDTATEYLRSGVAGLGRCAGPFAEHLADSVSRRAARQAELAGSCRRLAQQAAQAGVDARTEQLHRLALRDAYEAERHRDDHAAAATAAGHSTAGGGGGGEGW